MPRSVLRRCEARVKPSNFRITCHISRLGRGPGGRSLGGGEVWREGRRSPLSDQSLVSRPALELTAPGPSPQLSPVQPDTAIPDRPFTGRGRGLERGAPKPPLRSITRVETCLGVDRPRTIPSAQSGSTRYGHPGPPVHWAGERFGERGAEAPSPINHSCRDLFLHSPPSPYLFRAFLPSLANKTATSPQEPITLDSRRRRVAAGAGGFGEM